jgi:hypothetical protein
MERVTMNQTTRELNRLVARSPAMRPKREPDWRAQPIRTWRQVAVAMQRRGDLKMTAQLAEWYHRKAIKRLRDLLADLMEK